MSGYTMTQPELYYSYSAAGTSLNTFTSEASIMGNYIIPLIPATFFDKVGNLSSAMKVRAYGNISSTGTPTFSVTARLVTSATTWTNSGLLLGTTTALTTQSSVSSGWWCLDFDVILRSIAAGGATSSIATYGTFSGSAFSSATSGPVGSMPATGTTAPNATFDNTGATSYWLWLSSTCSASSSSNAIILQALKIYLEN